MSEVFGQSPHRQFIQSPHRWRDGGTAPPTCGSIVVNATVRHCGWLSADQAEWGSWRYEYGDDADTPGWVYGNQVWYCIAGPGSGLDLWATTATDCACYENRFLTLTYLYESNDAFSGGWGDAGVTRSWRATLTIDKRLGKLVLWLEEYKLEGWADWSIEYKWYINPLNVPIETTLHGKMADAGFTFNAPGTVVAGFTDTVMTSSVTEDSATVEMTYGGYFQRITLTCSDPYSKGDAQADALALLELVDVSTQTVALAGLYTINGVADTKLRLDTQIFLEYATTYPVRSHIYSHDYPGFFDYQTAQSLVFVVPTDQPCAETYLDGLLSKYNYKPVFFNWYAGDVSMGSGEHRVALWQLAKCGVATQQKSSCLQGWWGQYCREYTISVGPPVVTGHKPWNEWYTADAGYPLGVIDVSPFTDWPDANPNTEGFSCMKPFDTSNSWIVLEPGDVIGEFGLGRLTMKCKLHATSWCCDEPVTFDFTNNPHNY